MQRQPFKLLSLLFNHPDVCPPTEKEPPFFHSPDTGQGLKYYLDQYFLNYNHKVLCEASTAISFTPFAARALYQTVPNVKLIFIVRNPIDRAYSNWKMYSKSEEDLSFEEAVDLELTELNNSWFPEEEKHWFW
ncbi:hypothetical protein AKJ60_00065 [candidate division MSBL1 archaeon SCGC-AAA385M11]|nr:hypothetical protein AKJ60_00065 [candidate division MSBL1 archaeon SCGC-AAA385M11]